MATITNEAKLTYTLSGNNYSKESEFNITRLANNVTMSKTGTPTTVMTGSVVTYTIVIVVASDTTGITNSIIRDNIPSSLSLVAGSLKVNGTAVPGDIVTGIGVSLSAGSTTTVEYKCTVV